jgi:hypothetical protein
MPQRYTFYFKKKRCYFPQILQIFFAYFADFFYGASRNLLNLRENSTPIFIKKVLQSVCDFTRLYKLAMVRILKNSSLFYNLLCNNQFHIIFYLNKINTCCKISRRQFQTILSYIHRMQRC